MRYCGFSCRPGASGGTAGAPSIAPLVQPLSSALLTSAPSPLISEILRLDQKSYSLQDGSTSRTFAADREAHDPNGHGVCGPHGKVYRG